MSEMKNDQVQNNKDIAALQREVFDTRFQHGVGRLSDTSKLKKSRKALARLLTQANAKQGN